MPVNLVQVKFPEGTDIPLDESSGFSVKINLTPKSRALFRAEKMVSSIRSSRNSKDGGDGHTSKEKANISKAHPSGVRKSARETSNSRPKTPSPLRKSKRLEKGTPSLTPTLKLKSGRLEKHNSPSPVRRSDRGKKIFSSSSSGSKKSEKGPSCPLDSKRKKEKNMIDVTKESEKAELDVEAIGMKRKIKNARSFMALFKRQRIKTVPDGDGGLERRDKLSDVSSDNSGGIDSETLVNKDDIRDDCSGRTVGELRDESNGIYIAPDEALDKSSCSLKDSHEDIQNNGNMDSSCRDNVPDESCSKYSHTSSSVIETGNMDVLESESSTFLAKTGDGSVCSEIGETFVHLKDSTPSPSPSPRCENCYVLGICVFCSKYKRVDYNSPEQELCSCISADEDLGRFSNCKDKRDNEAAVTSETAEKCDSRHSLTETTADSQMDGHENVCGLCNKSNKLLCCQGKGCKRFYHLSCLDPRLTDALPGVWHCPQCVQKKLLFGVHSVSEGIESICDVREVEVPNFKGVRQRQFLVKYHGLSHIHNHWVPEKQLLLEDSCLVSSFIEKDQILRWSAEWTVPHRLLRRRSIEDKIYIASSSVISVCNYEWLVKWHGLGYDHATWELDNACSLSSPLGHNLMKDCKNRCQRAKQEANQHNKEYIVKLSELPASQSVLNNENVLEHVNKLRACLFKCQNAVVFDDQEKAMTIIYFLRSMTEICRPFLIVTTSSSLSQWEAEFARLAPSVDVVVYNGNRENRKAIRSSEFYDEGDHLMLQVLLSSAEAAFEDLDSFSSIKWKAIVIDEYQQFGMSNDLERIKMLPIDSRILLNSGQIEDTPSEHLTMLSLLELPCDLDKLRNLKSETNDNLCTLKDRLSCFIAYGSNSHVSKLSEYWVPVQISYLQLEQYCATLLSNSVLRSCLTKDSVGALREIIIIARKCCDHPYLLDSSIQGRLIADKRPAAEILDIGIKSSGKLEVMDMMLSEIKTRGLQVLVVFQQSYSGSGVISTLSMLESFLEQRFGPYSYECVDNKVIPSEKHAAVSRFNKKETGQFIFLLDKRACSSIIKLSSLDVVIMYDSEWNPANDLRALQKLSIGSKVDQIKVFRLYSSFTVEERSLVLGKQNLNLDNNLQNFSRATSDTLLSWGAANLFRKLDEYHADGKSTSALNFSAGQLLLSKVTKEFQAILSGNRENADLDSVISKAKLGAGSYSTKVPLLGEAKVQLKDREEPHVFWRNLLDGKKYIWKHRKDEPFPRNRKRINYFDGSHSKPATERDDGVKKRQKMVDDRVGPTLALAAVSKEGPSTVKACNQSQNLQKDGSTANNNPNGMSGDNPFGCGVSKGMSKGKVVSSDKWKTLHSSLQAKMTRLCQVLKFSDDVTDIVLKLLEYVIMNRDINSHSQPIVQALQISLCWIAASITKTKINQKDSLMLAKQLLNYQCTEDQAHTVYLILKEMYSQCPEKIVDSGRHCSLPEEGTPKEKAAADDTDKGIKKLKNKFKKRMNRLVQKHQDQLLEFQRNCEKERFELLTDHDLKSTFIRSVHGKSSAGIDKLKILSDDLAEKMLNLNIQKDAELIKLEARQSADIAEEEKKTAQWLAEAKAYSSRPEAVSGLESLGPQLEEQVVQGHQQSDTRAENLVTVNSPNEAGVLSVAMIESVNQSKDSNYDDEGVPANPPASMEPVPDEVERNASEEVSDKGCKSISPNEAVAGGGSQRPRQPQKVQQDKAYQSLDPVELQGLDESAAEKQSTLQTEAEAIFPVSTVPSNHETSVTNANVTPVPPINGTTLAYKTVTPVPSSREAPVTDKTVTSVPSYREAPVAENSGLLSCIKPPATENNNQGGSSPQTAEPRGTEVLPNVTPVPSNNETPVTNNTVTPLPSSNEAPMADKAVTSVPSNRESPVTENSEFPSSNSQSTEKHYHRRSSPQTAEPRGTEVLSHEYTTRSGKNSNVHNNHPNNTGHVNSAAQGQSVELSSSQNGMAIQPQVVMSTAERPNQAVLHSGIDPSVLLSHQHTSGSFHSSLSADPLQNEFDNLCREAEQVENNQKGMISQLSSDCEKEIQEAIAQVRKKYEVKFKEGDAEYQSKKKELEKNQKKVLMNKILAAVFRSKCSDPRPAGVPFMQRVAPSSSVQHMHHLSKQPSAGPPSRPSSSHPLSTRPITIPSPQTVQQQHLSRAHPVTISSTLVNQSISTVRSPTFINQSIRPPTILNQNVPSAPVQAVHNTTELFSSTPPPPRGPPHIGTITSSRNTRPGGEIRSAAPHLQSFRPATSASNPQIRTPHSLPFQLPPLSASTKSLYSQNKIGRLPQAPLPNNRPFVSAAESHSTFDLPEIRSKFGSLELSDLETLANDGLDNNQTSSLVCLSDDD